MEKGFAAFVAFAVLINVAIWGGIGWAVYELVTWLTSK